MRFRRGAVDLQLYFSARSGDGEAIAGSSKFICITTGVHIYASLCRSQIPRTSSSSVSFPLIKSRQAVNSVYLFFHSRIFVKYVIAITKV